MLDLPVTSETDIPLLSIVSQCCLFHARGLIQTFYVRVRSH